VYFKHDDKKECAESDVVKNVEIALKQKSEEKINKMSDLLKDVKNAGEQNDESAVNIKNEEEDAAVSDILLHE